MARVLLLPEAAREVRAIDRWWKINTARPSLFAEEWQRARGQLRTTPLIGPPCPGQPEHRRLLLPLSQHYVYYRHNPALNEVVILAVWSTRRGEGPPL